MKYLHLLQVEKSHHTLLYYLRQLNLGQIIDPFLQIITINFLFDNNELEIILVSLVNMLDQQVV